MRWLKNSIRAALGFLAWLTSRNETVELVTQSSIDVWFARKSSTKWLATDFLRWTIGASVLRDIIVPHRPQAGIGEAVAARAIEDVVGDNAKKISVAVRAAAMLNDVYAQQLSRIVSLSTNEVRYVDDLVYILRPRGRRLRLEPKTAELLRELRLQAHENPKAKRDDGSLWLFPGSRFGTHLSERALEAAFSRLGIRARERRNNALGDFASTVPAPVFGAMLGLHANTAADWSEAFGSNFGDFTNGRRNGARSGP